MMPEAREKSKNKPILNTYYMYLFMNNLDGFDLVLAIEFRIGSHSFHFVSFLSLHSNGIPNWTEISRYGSNYDLTLNVKIGLSPCEIRLE